MIGVTESRRPKVAIESLSLKKSGGFELRLRLGIPILLVSAIIISAVGLDRSRAVREFEEPDANDRVQSSVGDSLNSQSEYQLAPSAESASDLSSFGSNNELDSDLILQSDALPLEAAGVDNVRMEKFPALPGLAGYNIYIIAGTRNPAKELASEDSDPNWAGPMENRILDALPRAIDIPVTQVHVVCRTTRCGAVVVYPERLTPEQRSQAGEYLKNVFETSAMGNYSASRDGIRFNAYYFAPTN